MGILVAACLVVGGLFVLLGEEPHGSRSARSGRTAAEALPERRGFLSFSIRVESADGRPAAGARVEYEGATAGATSVDAHGRAYVDRLVRGSYVLRARKAGQTGTLRFTLQDTTHLGTLHLARAVGVRGRVFGVGGVPLSGAIVEALSAGDEDGAGMAIATRLSARPESVAARGSSDAHGAYSIRLAVGSRYAMRAARAGYAVRRMPARTVVAGVELDFHLQPGATVAGHVVDDRGFSLADARVMIVEPGLPQAETRTRSDGSFELAVLTSVAPMLVARAPGFAPYFQPGVRLPATSLRIELERGIAVRLRVVDAEQPGLALPGVSVLVDLEGGFEQGATDGRGVLTLASLPARRNPSASGDVVILWGEGRATRVHPIAVDIPLTGTLDLGDLPLAKGGTVSGRVLAEGSEAPVAGAQVRTFGGLPRALTLLAAPRTRSATDGSFWLEGVPLEATHVVALHPDYEAPAGLERLLSSGQMEGGAPLFPGGQRSATRDIVLRPAGQVRGSVMDQAGEPVAGATVHVLDRTVRAAAPLGGASRDTRTDADGRFLLTGLPGSRRFGLMARHPEAGESLAVSFMSGDEVALTLRPPHTLRGEVVDERQAPVAGVRISGEGRLAVSDARGTYTLRGLPRRQVTLRFDHRDYLVLERAVQIENAEQRIGGIRLMRGPGITGSVVDPAGAPVVGVTIRAVQDAGESGPGRAWGEANTDEQGRFAIHGLARGTYRLECPDGFAETPLVHTDSESPARAVLREAVRLSGRIVCGGEPVPGAQVEAGGLGLAASRADGSFGLRRLPPGSQVDLTVRHDGYHTARKTAAQDGVEIELDPGRQVGGTVALADATPVPGALVEVLADGSRARLVQADGRGRFLAGGLREGELAVRVVESGLGLLVSDAVPATVGDREIRLLAARGESITGMVFAPDGTPAAKVRVQAIARDGKVAAAAWIDRAGAGFALRGLAPGTYVVRAQRRRPAGHAEMADVPAGSRRVDLRLREGD